MAYIIVGRTDNIVQIVLILTKQLTSVIVRIRVVIRIQIDDIGTRNQLKMNGKIGFVHFVYAVDNHIDGGQNRLFFLGIGGVGRKGTVVDGLLHMKL